MENPRDENQTDDDKWKHNQTRTRHPRAKRGQRQDGSQQRRRTTNSS